MDLMQERWTTGRRVRWVVGVLLAAGFLIECQRLTAEKPPGAEARPPAAGANVAYATVQPPAGAIDLAGGLAKRDPVAFLRSSLERYNRSVHDYTCTFTKQELVNGRLTPEQVMHVKVREKPFSVNMLWVKNADKARRAIYVEGKWTGANGEKLAVVEPAGAIAQLLVDDVMRPIDGPDARKAARRQIDQFGFANSLKLILRYCELAARRNELNIRYVGEGTHNGRPTYVLERWLPYVEEGGEYPDRVLVVHMDKEHLLPTCCISYADDAKTKLLGRYELTDVRFNVGLTDADFSRKGETR